MEKLLSIIIPAYNLEAYLPKCLQHLGISDSTLHSQLDIIIVNDGSTDRTGAIAHEFAARHPDVVRVIDKPNGNYGSCVNVGLAAATGRFVRVLDADDWVRTDRFADFLAFLSRQDPSRLPDVVVTAYEVVDPNDAVTDCHRFDFLPPREILSLDEVRGFDRSFFQNHCVTYRRGLFDGDWYHQLEGCSYTDMQWFMLPLARAKTLTVFPLPVVCYLVGRAGQTVERTTLLQGTGTQCRVLGSIIAELNAAHPRGFSTWPVISQELMRQQLRWLYGGVLFAGAGNAGLASLAEFDVHLATLAEFDTNLATLAPELHRQVGDFHRRLFHFHYVREWRRRHSLATLKFRLFNFCTRIVDAAARRVGERTADRG